MAGEKRGPNFGTGLILGATIGALAGLFSGSKTG